MATDDLDSVLEGLEERKKEGKDTNYAKTGSGVDKILSIRRNDGFKGRMIWVELEVVKSDPGDLNAGIYNRSFKLPATGEEEWKRKAKMRDIAGFYRAIEPTFSQSTPEQQKEIIRSSYSDEQPYAGKLIRRNAKFNKNETWININWGVAQ